MKPLLITVIAGTALLAEGVLAANKLTNPDNATTVAQNSQVNRNAPAQATHLKTATLKVGNMYCASCPVIVRRVLEQVPGVSRATVSYKSKTATVAYDPAQCNAAKLAAAVSKLGYPTTVVE